MNAGLTCDDEVVVGRTIAEAPGLEEGKAVQQEGAARDPHGAERAEPLLGRPVDRHERDPAPDLQHAMRGTGDALNWRGGLWWLGVAVPAQEGGTIR